MELQKKLNENREVINRLLERFFPKKITEEWVKEITRENGDGYSIDALNNALAIPIWDFFDRGGKRWRPLLAALCCEAVGGKPQEHPEIMLIPELLHNGSLIVDDIEDDSELRRGIPSLHKRYGIDIALNAGNTLYYLPYKIIKHSNLPEEKKIKLYELMNDEVLKLHLGQATDIYWHKNTCKVNEKEYLLMCANKTGGVVRLSAKLGAILGAGKYKQIAVLGDFAERIGIAFQIQDDILNLSGSLGKEYGDDITEGKKSFPVIRTLMIADENDAKKLREILSMHTREKELIREAISIIKKYDGMTYSANKAAELVKGGLAQIGKELEESEAKTALKELAEFMISRSH